MAQRNDSFETRLTRRVKGLYLNKGHALGYQFPDNPLRELRAEWFEEVFATAAHEREFGLCYHRNKLAVDLSPAQLEERRQYNRYFGIVQGRVQDALKRIAKNAAGTVPIRPEDIIRRVSCPPVSTRVQPCFSNLPPPKRGVPAEAMRRLMATRDELAKRAGS